MSCSVDYSVIERYPDVLVAMFMSSAEDITKVTDTEKNEYIQDNYVGYLNELDRIGQAGSAPGTTKNNNLANNPYSTYLRPVSDLSALYNAQKVFIHKMEFMAFDTTWEDSENQDSDVITTIYDSRSLNNTYIQSNGFNSQIPATFQPNFFRPDVRINSREIIQGITSSNYGNKANKGDLSIGLPLPWCYDVNREIGSVKSIEAFAQLVQPIKVPDVVDYSFQRYAIQMLIYFRIGTGTVYAKNG